MSGEHGTGGHAGSREGKDSPQIVSAQEPTVLAHYQESLPRLIDCGLSLVWPERAPFLGMSYWGMLCRRLALRLRRAGVAAGRLHLRQRRVQQLAAFLRVPLESLLDQLAGLLLGVGATRL